MRMNPTRPNRTSKPRPQLLDMAQVRVLYDLYCPYPAISGHSGAAVQAMSVLQEAHGVQAFRQMMAVYALDLTDNGNPFFTRVMRNARLWVGRAHPAVKLALNAGYKVDMHAMWMMPMELPMDDNRRDKMVVVMNSASRPWVFEDANTAVTTPNMKYQTYARLGKVLSTMFPTMGAANVTALCEQYQGLCKHGGLRIVQDAEEIENIMHHGMYYAGDSFPHSCMTRDIKNYRFDSEEFRASVGHLHPYAAYSPALGWGLAVLDMGAGIVGRAVVHVGEKTYVRAFGKGDYTTDHGIDRALDVAGYTKVENFAGYPLAYIPAEPYGTIIPYVDGRTPIAGVYSTQKACEDVIAQAALGNWAEQYSDYFMRQDKVMLINHYRGAECVVHAQHTCGYGEEHATDSVADCHHCGDITIAGNRSMRYNVLTSDGIREFCADCIGSYTTYSEYHGGHVYDHDSLECRTNAADGHTDVVVDTEDVVFSDYHECDIPTADAVYSKFMDSWILSMYACNATGDDGSEDVATEDNIWEDVDGKAYTLDVTCVRCSDGKLRTEQDAEEYEASVVANEEPAPTPTTESTHTTAVDGTITSAPVAATTTTTTTWAAFTVAPQRGTYAEI